VFFLRITSRRFDGLTASAFVMKIILYCQLTNLGVQLLYLAVLVLSIFDFVGKNACRAFDCLPFPWAHLLWVELPLGRNILNRLVTTQHLKRHSSFELV